MPISWIIDSRSEFVEVTAEGRVTLDHWVELMEVMEGARALLYTKLLDAREALLDLSAPDLMQVIFKARSYHERAQIGALSVVTGSRQAEQWSQLLGALAAASRPMRVFPSQRRARNWLGSVPSTTKSRPRDLGITHPVE